MGGIGVKSGTGGSRSQDSPSPRQAGDLFCKARSFLYVHPGLRNRKPELYSTDHPCRKRS